MFLQISHKPILVLVLQQGSQSIQELSSTICEQGDGDVAEEKER